MAHANGTVAAIHLQLYSLWHVPMCASRTVFRTYLVLAKLMNILQDLSVIIVIPSRLSTLTQYISTTIPGPSCRGVLAGLPHTTYRLPDRAPLGVGSWYITKNTANLYRSLLPSITSRDRSQANLSSCVIPRTPKQPEKTTVFPGPDHLCTRLYN